jgi:hypothetical protein
LESRLNIIEKDKDRLLRTSAAKARGLQVVQVTNTDPKVGELSRLLEGLIRENGLLISQVKVGVQTVATEVVQTIAAPVAV